MARFVHVRHHLNGMLVSDVSRDAPQEFFRG